MEQLTPELYEEMLAIQWWHRIPIAKDHTGNIIYTPGQVSHGERESEDYATSRFGLPLNLNGLKIADIGGWDGYFAFLAEKRGAAVTLFEVGREEGGNWGGGHGFRFAKKVLKSNVAYQHGNIYDLSPEKGIAPFDITLFFGVLYHLKAPLIALERLFSITKENGFSLIETAYENNCCNKSEPGWFFRYLDCDHTNYFFPNLQGLFTALYHVGFKNVELLYDSGARCTVKASR